MYAFRAIYARRIVLAAGFLSLDDAALHGRRGILHQMFLQHNCLHNVAR